MMSRDLANGARVRNAAAGAFVLCAGIVMCGIDAGAQSSRVGTATAPGSAPTAGVATSALARLDVRLTALEQELRATTGRIEDLSFQLQRLNQRFDTTLSDLEVRLDQIDGGAGGSTISPSAPSDGGVGAAGAGGAPSETTLARTPPPEQKTAPPEQKTPPPSETPAATGALPGGTPEEQYAYAFGLLRQAKYPEAEVAFSAFLEKHPDDELANNAGYWLGETYYVRKDYVKAAESFLNVYQKQKTGPKAPDALLKLAMSLGQLDKRNEACTTLNELKRAFPEAPERVKGKARDEGQRLGCS